MTNAPAIDVPRSSVTRPCTALTGALAAGRSSRAAAVEFVNKSTLTSKSLHRTMVRQRLPGGGANDTLLKKDGQANVHHGRHDAGNSKTAALDAAAIIYCSTALLSTALIGRRCNNLLLYSLLFCHGARLAAGRSCVQPSDMNRLVECEVLRDLSDLNGRDRTRI
jgi:hypothetical protein